MKTRINWPSKVIHITNSSDIHALALKVYSSINKNLRGRLPIVEGPRRPHREVRHTRDLYSHLHTTYPQLEGPHFQRGDCGGAGERTPQSRLHSIDYITCYIHIHQSCFFRWVNFQGGKSQEMLPTTVPGTFWWVVKYKVDLSLGHTAYLHV